MIAIGYAAAVSVLATTPAWICHIRWQLHYAFSLVSHFSRLAVQNGGNQVWRGQAISTAVFSIFGAAAWTVRHRQRVDITGGHYKGRILWILPIEKMLPVDEMSHSQNELSSVKIWV